MILKVDLVKEIVQSIGTTQKEARVVLEAILDSLVKAIRNGERVELRGFGTFSVRARNARVAFNPRMGRKTAVRAKRVVRFRPSKSLLASIGQSAETAAHDGDGAEAS